MNMIDKIIKIMDERKLSKADIAKGADLPYTTVDGIFKKGFQNMKLPTLQKLAAFLNVTMEYLINDNVDDESTTNKGGILNIHDLPDEFSISAMVNIPIVGAVRAGVPILAVENIESYFHLPKYLLGEDKEYFGLKVKGDSMNLEFQEGSILIVEKTSCIENNEIGIVLINGFDATVKKVACNGDMLTLIPMSSNPAYQPTIYNVIKDDIKIVGKVKYAIKTY